MSYAVYQVPGRNGSDTRISPDFNEIMPSIYSRFMEKEARQWRQIYKVRSAPYCREILLMLHQSLQLLEYLIKHGSERVVDDSRSHLATIKMLRSFHYIDDKGKDEGINGESTHVSVRSCHSRHLVSPQQSERDRRFVVRCRED